jgi:putative tryptophan/tyrosine transport system substrate-binding protein
VISRRQALVALAAAAWAVPLPLQAQDRVRVWRIGFLGVRRPVAVDTDVSYGEFTREMRELGYVEGKNLRIEWRFSDEDYNRLPKLAAELVQLKVMSSSPPPVLPFAPCSARQRPFL